MKNKKIRIESLNSTYSVIIIEKNGKEENHYISNNGFFPLKWWIEKFEKEL